MIQIKDKSQQVEVYFPRNERNFMPTLFKIKSVLRNVDYSYAIDAQIDGDYFKFTIDLSDLSDGEYKAMVTDGNQDHNTYTLLRIGEIKSNNIKYNSTITYSPYEK